MEPQDCMYGERANDFDQVVGGGRIHIRFSIHFYL